MTRQTILIFCTYITIVFWHGYLRLQHNGMAIVCNLSSIISDIWCIYYTATYIDRIYRKTRNSELNMECRP